MHDHVIKLWLESQVFSSDMSSSEHNIKHYGIQEKHWKLRKWSKESSLEYQSSNQ